MDRIPVDMLLRLRLRNLNLHNLPREELDALYASLSVQTMPEGRYDGRAWIYGHSVLGWFASFIWRGKVFYRTPGRVNTEVVNLVLWKRSIYGFVVEVLDADPRDSRYVIDPVPVSELKIHYRQLYITDTVRQVSPTLYLGRMHWRRWTVHFTLSQEMNSHEVSQETSSY